MLRRCGSWLVVLALVLSTGGHWAALQVMAWTGMLVRYTQEGTLGEAVVKTFDGRHPCRLCRLVREGRAEERSQAPAQAAPKLELLPPADEPGPAAPADPGTGARFAFTSGSSRGADSPPVPPPRGERCCRDVPVAG